MGDQQRVVQREHRRRGTYSYMDIHERDKSSKGTWQNDGGTYVFTDA
ncbi:MAG: hypothetical protein UHD09_06220 [Bifidobacterium sp.]|nr:hypothetical protein [Bifidobacterium sp.]